VTTSSSSRCGGTLNTIAPTGGIRLNGATVIHGTDCTFNVTVTATAAGNYTNTTGNVTSNEGGTGGTASAPLTVGAQAITFTIYPPASAAYGSNFTVAATGGGSGNPVVFTSSGSCTNVNATYTMTSTTGTCSVIANEAGSANYLPAPQVTLTVIADSSTRFVPITPCRVVDTRDSSEPAGLGPPYMSAGASRSFPLQSGSCGLPSGAQAYSLNVTAVPHGVLNVLTVWPTGQSLPNASTLNSQDGRVKANAAVVPGGTGGDVSVNVSNDTDVVIDVNGYFVSSTVSGALGFYSMTPCRVVDTRPGAPSTVITGPLTGGVSRTVPVLSSSCNIPATAQAYSMNFTVVPINGPVNFLTVYPTGQSQPAVSTLNDDTGTVVANAAIAPAGTSGSIDVFANQTTDLIVDINGYFAPVATGALSFYTLPSCRVADTRNPAGSPPFTGQIAVNVLGTCSVTSAARAYLFNATVVPSGAMGFLALWANGGVQPNASTLNANDGTVTSNMAVVPTGNGMVDAYNSGPAGTYLILDISGYFAP
jgi:hypothetical protein